MKLHPFIEQHWQQPKPWLHALLSPVSRCFARIAGHRRARYLSGSLNTKTLPVPVVILGNLHAGGTGKTPITAQLVRQWQALGIHVGIISRGYGRKSTAIHVLHTHSNADEAGDEPLMLYRQTHAPVAVGENRYAAGMALLAAHPNIQFIIADDGLQHYALARTLEIAVFPAADVGRHDLDMLPNGSLREPLTRLQTIDFVVVSHGTAEHAAQLTEQYSLHQPVFYSRTHAQTPYHFHHPEQKLDSGSLKTGQTCAAIAAIARPQRFFNSLEKQGFSLNQTHILPDHQAIRPQDWPRADYVLITEKDAVKLHQQNVPQNVWVLPIKTDIQPDLAQAVLAKLNIQAA